MHDVITLVTTLLHFLFLSTLALPYMFSVMAYRDDDTVLFKSIICFKEWVWTFCSTVVICVYISQFGTFCKRLLTHKSLFTTTYHICCQTHNNQNPFPANHNFLTYGPADISQHCSQPVLCQIHHASWNSGWILFGWTDLKKHTKHLWLIIFCQIRIAKNALILRYKCIVFSSSGYVPGLSVLEIMLNKCYKNMIFMKFNILAVWNHMMLFLRWVAFW